MNGSMWIPFFVVASADKSRRKRLADAMLPAMIPVAPAVQVAVAAVSADIQVRREDRRVATVQAQEAVKTKALLTQEAVKTKALLTQEAAKTEVLLTESVAAAEILLGKGANQTLTQAELDDLPAFKAALADRRALADKINIGPLLPALP